MSGQAADGVGPVNRHQFRGDLQGLRALAVVVVILDHLVGWPVGGFIGVDVFFVISGFLITDLLTREHDEWGTFSFADFYRRRVKRILPVAVLVVVVTVTASFLLFTPSRFMQTLWDGVWALIFAGNWRFATSGTDYFSADNAISPLQHYWSLGVEEQFYLVWPVVMFIIFAIAASRSRRITKTRRIPLVIAISVIVIASFAWGVYETATNPAWAYFSTFSRAWELGAGALIAVSARAFVRLPSGLRPVLGWAGLLLVIASLFVVTEASAFPAPIAALPVFGAMLIIIGGTGGTQRGMFPLTNPVSRWLGNLSYSLYLWHFPVIIFLGLLLGTGTLVHILASAALVLLLSVGSYYLVENPVRYSSWLVPKATSRRHRDAENPKRVLAGIGLVIVAGGTAALVAIALGPRPAADTSSTVFLGSQIAFDDSSVNVGLPPLTEADLVTALGTSTWPAQELSEDYLSGLQSKDVVTPSCFNNFEETHESCTYFSGGTPKVALIGDSIAMSWGPAVRAAFPGGEMTTYGKFACPWVDVLVSTSQGPEYRSCLDYHQLVYQRLEESRPDVIVLSVADFAIGNLSSGAEDAAAAAEWTAAVDASMGLLSQYTTRVVVLANPVPAQALSDCATTLNTPLDCITTVDARYEEMAAATSAGVAAASARGLPVTYIDTRSWFCASDGRCPVIFDGLPIRADGVHIVGSYSKRLGPNLREALIAVDPGLFGIVPTPEPVIEAPPAEEAPVEEAPAEG